MSLSLGVVIPTYRRPTWLRGAHASLAQQADPPDVICLVCRDSDAPSLEVAHELARTSAVTTQVRTVSKPGFVPPVREGTGALTSQVDLVALLDDDAEAEEGWSRLARRRFDERADLGFLAGRVVNYTPERVPIDEGRATQVACMDWRGRFVGNMYRDPPGPGPFPARFFMGGNVCMRAQRWRELEFDPLLNRNVAYHYEVDLAQQVLAAGYQGLYDPAWRVRHYTAPREIQGQRALGDGEGIRWGEHNLFRIHARRLSGVPRVVALTHDVLVGSRHAPGLLSAPALVASERSLRPVRAMAAATHGRAHALLELLLPPA